MAAGILRRISPFGPIFGKELRVSARRKRTYLLRSAYLLFLLLILTAVYAITCESRGGAPESVAARCQRQAELAQIFLATFTLFGVIAMAMVGPVLTSTAISSERAQKTLNVLLMTPINAWQIVAGKLFSRLLVALTLIGLSLPVLGVVRLLGGVEANQIAAILTICLITAMFSAALGLFLSTFMTRTYAVILLAYAFMALLYLFVPMVATISMRGLGMRQERLLLGIIFALNPFATAVAEVSPFRVPFNPFWPCVITHLTMTALLVTGSALALRRISGRLASGGGAAAMARVPDAPMALDLLQPALPVQPSRRPASSGRLRDIWDNPILWRESHQPLFKKKWQAIAGGIITLLLLGSSYAVLGFDSSENLLMAWRTQADFACISEAVLLLLIGVIAPTGIVVEKESDTWPLLMATPLSARAIVWGKFVGTLSRLKWAAILVGAHFLIFTLCGAVPVLSLLAIVWVFLTFNLLWVSTGLCLSLFCRRVTTAVILNLLLMLVFYALPPLLLGMYDSWYEAHHDGLSRQVELVQWYIPFWYLGTAMEWFNGQYSYSGGSGIRDPDSWGLGAVGMGIAYMLATWGIAEFAIARFDKWVGRAAQRQPLDTEPVAIA